MTIAHHIHPLEPPVWLREDLHPYAHGGGFGIATEILADPSLAEVLKILEPRRFKECDRILNGQNRVLNAISAKKITLAMENSPVVAALAQVKFGQISIEWDLWLDPKEPGSLERAVIEHGSTLAMLFKNCACARSHFLKSAPSVNRWIETYIKATNRFNTLYKRNIERIPSICLDIKSSWSTARDINLFIQNLKQIFQIDVAFVGSFSYEQITDVSGPKRVLFCHALWDLKEKVESGYFPLSIMLNGADLEDNSNLVTLRQIATDNHLEIGVYLQEPEAGTSAVQRLIKMVNAEPELFKLGFALGNSRDGRAPRMIQGSGAGVQKILLSNSILLKTALKIKHLLVQIKLLALSFFQWLHSVFLKQ